MFQVPNLFSIGMRWHRSRGRAATRRRTPRRGITLIEILVASTVVAMIVGSLGLLAQGVRTTQEISEQHRLSSQHARVILDRLQRNMRSAIANIQFPGFVVFSEQIGIYTYPDTLVVWRPNGKPADAAGLPRWNEVLIYGWNPTNPRELLEITLPNDTTTVPDLSDLSSWQAKLTAAKNGTGATRVVLTDRLRVAAPQGAPNALRGVIRFDAALRPTPAEWNAYLQGSTTWEAMLWPQNIFSSTNGLRQNRCSIELQFHVGKGDTPDGALPFIDSAAVYFQVPRP